MQMTYYVINATIGYALVRASIKEVSVLFSRTRRPSQDDYIVGLERWQQYCREVAAAAEVLRDIALRAEGRAHSVYAYEDGLGRIAREIGCAAPIPAPSHDAQTYATMMLGPFAALEELRRKLSDTQKTTT